MHTLAIVQVMLGLEKRIGGDPVRRSLAGTRFLDLPARVDRATRID
jgi:hypothetical protein